MISGFFSVQVIFLFLLLLAGDSNPPSKTPDLLWHHRNLGKAYYENPMTQEKAVEEFREALALSGAVRDRVNYGLALLRAGKTNEGIAELLKAQKENPTIPHTWFNLGMAYKKKFDHKHSIEQFQGMLKLVPDEPVTHYNLGVEYKLTDRPELAMAEFLKAEQLDPNFAAPHYQLFTAYRNAGRKEDAARELDAFNEIKKRKAGAAVQEDPEWNAYAEIYDTVDLNGEFDRETSTTPPFKFIPSKVASGIDAQSGGMTVMDFDGDGHPDLLVWSKNGLVLLKDGSVPQPNTGLEGLKDVNFVAAGDFNNDGLPDLAVITVSAVKLYVNRGGKFELFPADLPAGPFTKAVWMDYDHDYDLDLVLLGSKAVLLRNEGAKGFSDQTSRFPFVNGRALDAALIDLVSDNSERDLAVLYDDGSIVLYRDMLLGHFEAQPQANKISGASSIQAFDIDNDGWTDLLVTTKNGVRLLLNHNGKLTEKDGPGQSGPMVLADLADRSLADLVVGNSIYRNLGRASFAKSRTDLPLQPIALAQADFDSDGRTDLAVLAQDGSVQLLKNETATSNNFIGVRLEGVKNLKVAEGAIVEVKTGAWYQKRIYLGVPLLFGIRSYPQADTLRITWPNGLIQNEIKEQAGKELSYKEKPRLSGSCPMIFAWNGSAFQFITDVLGVAPLGASNGDGQYFPVNHRENIQIPASALKMQNGRFEIRVTEELREVSYLDKIQLMAVDNPAGEELVTNDKFKAPPFPEFRLFGVRKKIYPVSARDENGVDVLAKISKLDDRYADTFHCGNAGTAPMHELVLDFNQAAPDGRAVLILNGWVDWADGSTFAGAAQESENGLVFPYLQVKDEAGKWQTVIPDMGMPSGKPKFIAVDLTGKFLSKSREVKIVTNLCVYWDEIFLSEQTAAPAVKMMALPYLSADLHYRGFSAATAHPGEPRHEEFDYAKWSPTTMWNPTPGLYTRYGDVRSLLERIDDQMVIMGSGDELRLTFDAARLPALPRGWERSYLLLVDGWAKDADANTAFPRSVEPLPFHGMVSYPYPPSQHFPDDAAHQLYRKKFLTRAPVRDLDALHREDSGAN
jgi:Tfp pilus assembly protein PilF